MKHAGTRKPKGDSLKTITITVNEKPNHNRGTRGKGNRASRNSDLPMVQDL
jgi:hypothetical protein